MPFRIFRQALIWLIFLALLVPRAQSATNYVCVVCGKGPLTGRFYLHPKGAVCDECAKNKDRCSICGLPVLEGDGHLKTGDGRLICKYDKPYAVMTLEQAKDLFEKTREKVVDLYGPEFELRYKDVNVTLFDVDYWSEKGGRDGLHAFGFASSRPSASGAWTHEVVMLSGRTWEEMESVAAHEYTHLWINENCPKGHHIDGDTVEAICELTAYKFMQHKGSAEMQQRILDNPYTRGKIKDLITVEHEGGTDYVLNWVKTSNEAVFDVSGSLAPLNSRVSTPAYIPGPRVLPQGLKFSGTMAFGKELSAVINGKEFMSGDQKSVSLSTGSVIVKCLEVKDYEVKIQADGKVMTLEQGKEKRLP